MPWHAMALVNKGTRGKERNQRDDEVLHNRPCTISNQVVSATTSSVLTNFGHKFILSCGKSCDIRSSSSPRTLVPGNTHHRVR
jgi:hypothetical protein